MLNTPHSPIASFQFGNQVGQESADSEAGSVKCAVSQWIGGSILPYVCFLPADGLLPYGKRVDFVGTIHDESQGGRSNRARAFSVDWSSFLIMSQPLPATCISKKSVLYPRSPSSALAVFRQNGILPNLSATTGVCGNSRSSRLFPAI